MANHTTTISKTLSIYNTSNGKNKKKKIYDMINNALFTQAELL